MSGGPGALALGGAFLLGAMPFAYLIPKMGYGIDVRRRGSGNPGATNVFRTVGAGAGLLVGVLDVVKGWAAVLLMERLEPEWGPVGRVGAAIAAVAGHNWSPWLGFKGGKGILTSAGAFARLAWLPVAIAAALFGIALAVGRYVSVGSMLAAVALPVLIATIPGPWQSPPVEVAACVIAVMAVVRHHGNIRRLLRGDEGRIGRGPRRPR